MGQHLLLGSHARRRPGLAGEHVVAILSTSATAARMSGSATASRRESAPQTGSANSEGAMG